MANCKLLFNTIQALDNIDLAHTSNNTMINKLNKQILLGKRRKYQIIRYPLNVNCVLIEKYLA